MTLEARNLTAGYGRVMILHGVSIAVPTGGVVAILGPNGAGKSTLLRTLAGLLPVMEGELWFEDERYDGSDPRSIADSGIVLVPQRRSVFGELSVAENLALPALDYKSSEGNPAEEMLMRFPVLAERAFQPAGSLSGGERQILAVAAALVMKPKVLLLDEPTSGLSPLATAEIANVIGACTERGVAVAWVVEQIPEVALREADHAYFLEGGEITFSDEASLLLDRERLRALMLDHT